MPVSLPMPGYHSYRRTASHSAPPAPDDAGHTVAQESESLGARLRRSALTGNNGVFRRMYSFGSGGHKESRQAATATAQTQAQSQAQTAVATTTSQHKATSSSGAAVRTSPSSESVASEGSGSRWADVSFSNPLRRPRSESRGRNHQDQPVAMSEAGRSTSATQSGSAGKSVAGEEDPGSGSASAVVLSANVTDGASPRTGSAATFHSSSSVSSTVAGGPQGFKRSVRRTESLPGSQEMKWKSPPLGKATSASELPKAHKRSSVPRELPVEVEDESPPPPPVPLRAAMEGGKKEGDELGACVGEPSAVAANPMLLQNFQGDRSLNGGNKRTRQEGAVELPEINKPSRAGKEDSAGAVERDGGDDMEILRRKLHFLTRANRKLTKKVARRDKTVSNTKIIFFFSVQNSP